MTSFNCYLSDLKNHKYCHFIATLNCLLKMVFSAGFFPLSLIKTHKTFYFLTLNQLLSMDSKSLLDRLNSALFLKLSAQLISLIIMGFCSLNESANSSVHMILFCCFMLDLHNDSCAQLFVFSPSLGFSADISSFKVLT